MKLANAFALFTDLWLGLTIAFLPTLKDILKNPLLLFRPDKISALYFTKVWALCSGDADANGKAVKDSLITPHAYGVVLDIGAGFGHTVRYLDRSRVSCYVALEPNPLMHPKIRGEASARGFHESDGTLVVLGCGAEDTRTILAALAPPTSPADQRPAVDTIVSVLTLCTVPEPQRAVEGLVRAVLKPGGQLLMYEHVLSRRADVAWWQRFWTPLWALFFDGCRLDRPSDIMVSDVKVANAEGKEESAWREVNTWGKEGEDEENLWFHSAGRFIKR